jgi:hypothetical protein
MKIHAAFPAPFFIFTNGKNVRIPSGAARLVSYCPAYSYKE